MGYNLWMSEDSHYTLGRRIGTQAGETPAAPEQRTDAAAQPSAVEMDRIASLMEQLARRLEAAPPNGSAGA
jgi:hypothetical protein